GDSRVYLFRGHRLCRLTRDHTIAQGLADRGYIAPQEIAAHRLRHVLTKWLGESSDVTEPEIMKFVLENNDCMLLCSDGLKEMVRDEDIAVILGSDRSADEICQCLIDAALAAGGKDNITAIVARFAFPATEERAQEAAP